MIFDTGSNWVWVDEKGCSNCPEVPKFDSKASTTYTEKWWPKSLYYGSIPTIKTFWDKAFTEIILLASFLEQRNIKYLFLDMCNEFDRIHIKGYSGFEKLKLIEQNRNIVDLFSFCGNRYMWNTIKNNKDVDFNTHHAPEQYQELEKNLLNYVENNTYNKN